MDTTTVTHPYGDAAPQVAIDILKAAFSALGGIQSRGDLDTEVLTEAQQHLNDAYNLVRLIHPEVCN